MTPTAPSQAQPVPDYPQIMGHPRPLWMLFMTEFWERFAFYGMRWALALYIVAEFFHGDASGQGYASRTYGAYLALVYASAIFGGYVADRILGYQRSILVGAAVMGLGLFMVMVPQQDIFLAGLATVIVGNGLFKPNISSLVGQIYPVGDDRRDRGFTLFYMGINLGGFLAPLVTGWIAAVMTDTPLQENYRAVFASTGIGMVICFIWFLVGRKQLKGVGVPPPERHEGKSLLAVIIGIVIAVPLVYLLMAKAGAIFIAWLLGALFVGVAAMLVIEAVRHDTIQIHRVIAMLVLFAFNVLFWMFFEQAGSSFNFLAQNLVDRLMFGWEFPVGWFQSVNSAAILVFAPPVAIVWAWLAKRRAEPSIPRKFGLGLIFNALGFLVLMYALKSLVDGRGLIPFWPLAACYVAQTIGELCLSPIGLSMVTKLAPIRVVGLAMGGWFLSTAIGNNLSGLLAGHISGESGMTVASALSGFTFSFELLIGAGIVLFLIAPLINKLMHGIK
ncbi:peptide MFS transporter [Luteibacter aegosomatissinici]|uniref:peptide MFS transporter n=1 Tax=Luteibacter aegosomatissinici TaxID=2911539 RepID=UPI001FFB410C|nr:peptide MFS transporter [Luteibacter aegosomatissinici]UPG95311.1 peptide MFS transporter [Luteibacter aegosomatissinici]